MANEIKIKLQGMTADDKNEIDFYTQFHGFRIVGFSFDYMGDEILTVSGDWQDADMLVSEINSRVSVMASATIIY